MRNILISVPGKKEKLPLSVTHPELAKEAYGWDPSEIVAGSHSKLNWKCNKDHSWLAAVQDRSRRGDGCPICIGKKVLVGYNDLSTLNPTVASQADGWDPTTVTVGSGKKFQWRCTKDHSWMATVASRTNGTNCPVCNGKQVEVGFNDLEGKYPSIALQADGWNPRTVTDGSGKKMPWKCELDHRWEATVSDRTRKGNGCPFCSNQRLLIGFNDLKTTHPELASEADGWDPTSIVAGYSKKMKWKCSAGHNWNSAPSSRSTNKAGCAVCANQKVLAGFNDLATRFPLVANEADGWDPREVLPHSKKPRQWKCTFGHTWSAAIGNRTRTGKQGCPVCTGHRVLAGFNDLRTTYPDVAILADGWDPSTVTAGSNKVADWKCIQGHKWKTAIHSLTLQGTGCPFCSGQKLQVGFNDLATSHPDIAVEAFGWNPETIGKSSKSILKWKCPLGHIYEAVVVNRTFRGDQCSFCSGKQVLAGFNDLLTSHPLIAAEAVGWNTTTVTAGSNLKKLWQCAEGHKWTSTVNSRTGSNTTGCPSCAQSGFDPNQDGFLYFLIHESWVMFQIGITNTPDDRLSRHSRLGWRLLELRGPMDGHLTQQWETAILRMLKAKGADLSNSKIAGKFDGYSEAWSKSTFEVRSIKELMNLTEEFEDNQ